MHNLFKLLSKTAFVIILCLFTYSCGGGPFAKLPGGAADIPADGRERAKKNIEEGRGISIGGLGKKKLPTNSVHQIQCGEQHLM